MRVLVFTLSLVVSACSTSAPAELKQVPLAATSVGTAPIIAEWMVRDETAQSAKLTLQITKRLVTEFDLSVSLQVPNGISLEPARRNWTVPAAAIGTFAAELDLRWANTPTDDLVAVVDTQGKSFGLHAEPAYRFGRPEPTTPVPVKTGEPATIGNTNLGTPVPLDRR